MTDITINGIPRRPASEGNTPFLWYLRRFGSLAAAAFADLSVRYGPIPAAHPQQKQQAVGPGYRSQTFRLGHRAACRRNDPRIGPILSHTYCPIRNRVID
jgi:hypothetical protein